MKRRAALELVGVIAGLALVIVVLQRAGRGDLAAPPLHSWPAFTDWLHERDGVTAAFAVLRLVALAVAWYVAATVALGSVGRITGRRGLVRVTDAVTASPVRWLLATFAVAPVMMGSLAHDAKPPAETAAATATDALVLLPDTPTADDRLTLLPGDDGTATMHRLPDAPPTWTVQRGDHFWHIAEDTLAEAWGRRPTDNEIDPYWRQLIDLNRAKLVHPGNPDLIFPGQVMDLPPVP